MLNHFVRFEKNMKDLFCLDFSELFMDGEDEGFSNLLFDSLMNYSTFWDLEPQAFLLYNGKKFKN